MAYGDKAQGGAAMRGSLVITAFFIAGILCALSGLLPAGTLSPRYSYYALSLLMFSVGVGIGCDSDVVSKFRTIDPLLLLLPLFTIAGTLAGVSAASLFMPGRSLSDCLAVGSGFGYYSLSSIFITEYRGAGLGTVALLANIIRELVTLLFAPLLAARFGKLAPISVGGATTMDTTLPIISRVSGQSLVIVSIYHGFVVDLAVPFLVTLFCQVSI